MLDLIEAFKRENCGKLPQEHGSLYNKILSPFKDMIDVRVLEIGIWQCVSLEIWKAYFTKPLLFAIDSGIDSVIKARSICYEAYNGDQSYEPFMKLVADRMKSLDIVIDDGGHWADDQQVSFNALWPILNKNGLYIIEDLWVAKDRAVNGYKNTLDFLDTLTIKKEFYVGNNNFEKDICVLYKE